MEFDFLSIISDVIMNLFTVIFTVLNGILSVVFYPFNVAMLALMPDFSNHITTIFNGLQAMFANIAWPLSILPRSLITSLIFCYGFRYAVQSVALSNKMLVKVWNILQKVKFW